MTQLAQPYSVIVPGAHLMAELVGHRDAHLKLIERSFPECTIVARGNEIHVVGEQAAVVGRLCEELVTLLQRGQQLDESSVKRAIDMVRENESPARVLSDDILRGAKGKPIRPKTAGQKRYVDAIRDNVITFGLGPAGTGKSWLAVAMAVLDEYGVRDLDDTQWEHVPTQVAELVDFIVARVLDQLGVEHELMRRWGRDDAAR